MEHLLLKVQEAFKSAFDVDPQSVNIDTRPEDIPGWDSMGHVTLTSCLESAFGLNFDVDDLMEMEDVRKILQVVQGKFGKAQRG